MKKLTKGELIIRLQMLKPVDEYMDHPSRDLLNYELDGNKSPVENHKIADLLLLSYIDDVEVTSLFLRLEKWYE